MFGRNQSDERTDGTPGQPVPITDLCRQPERRQRRHPAKTPQPGHHRGERGMRSHLSDSGIETVPTFGGSDDGLVGGGECFRSTLWEWLWRSQLGYASVSGYRRRRRGVSRLTGNRCGLRRFSRPRCATVGSSSSNRAPAALDHFHSLRIVCASDLTGDSPLCETQISTGQCACRSEPPPQHILRSLLCVRIDLPASRSR